MKNRLSELNEEVIDAFANSIHTILATIGLLAFSWYLLEYHHPLGALYSKGNTYGD